MVGIQVVWNHRSVVEIGITVMLSVGFAFLGMAKVFSGYRPTFLLPECAHYVLAMVEIALGIAIWNRQLRNSVCGIAVLLAAVGLVLGLLRPDLNCGCLGTLAQLSQRQHLGLAIILGGLASGLLGCRATTVSGRNGN